MDQGRAFGEDEVRHAAFLAGLVALCIATSERRRSVEEVLGEPTALAGGPPSAAEPGPPAEAPPEPPPAPEPDEAGSVSFEEDLGDEGR
jgi:hypothetical protein